MAAVVVLFLFIWAFYTAISYLFRLLEKLTDTGLMDQATSDLLDQSIFIAYLLAIPFLFIFKKFAQVVLDKAVYAYRILVFPFYWYMRGFGSETGHQMKARHTRRKQARAARRKFRGTKLD